MWHLSSASTWFLATVVALQPLLVRPCFCAPPKCGHAKPTVAKTCCQKKAAAVEQRCCCTKADVCRCEERHGPPTRMTSPPTVYDGHSAVPLVGLGHSIDVATFVSRIWAIDFLPSSLSASERCNLLCRLVI